MLQVLPKGQRYTYRCIGNKYSFHYTTKKRLFTQQIKKSAVGPKIYSGMKY